MNASKEEARKANKDIETCCEKMDLLVPAKADRDELKRYLIRVQDFVEAAEKKLPTEAAYAREKTRRKTKV